MAEHRTPAVSDDTTDVLRDDPSGAMADHPTPAVTDDTTDVGPGSPSRPMADHPTPATTDGTPDVGPGSPSRLMADRGANDTGDGPVLDLGSDPRHVHIVGIGGAGMSAIAGVLSELGHLVTGSDLKRSAAFERLAASGLAVGVGHLADHIRRPAGLGAAAAGSPRPDLVARSTAVGDANPEVQAARSAGISVCSRAEILAAICRLRRTLAVAGTHGKTTTASMLGLILSEARCKPSFIVGGELNEIGSGAAWGAGDWLVVEADESDGTFLRLDPEAAVVTSVEADHLDRYGSEAGVHEAFAAFLAGVGGFRLVCSDDPWGRDYAAAHPGTLTYGRTPPATYGISELRHSRTGVDFTVRYRPDAGTPGTTGNGSAAGGVRDTGSGAPEQATVRLPVPGEHNALNATAAMACAHHLGVPPATSAAILAHYGGVARRYEFRGEAAGITFVDDYAHLPSEVEAVLRTARAGDWRRVVCVYQPHRYTRTAALWRDFGASFAEADLLVLTDVYAAGEPPQPGVSGKLLVDAVLEAEPAKRVAWFPHRVELIEYLTRELRAGDLCLTLNAGDLTTLPAALLARLEP